MIGDVWRVTAQWTSTAADVFQWVWHIRQATGADPSAEDIASAVVTQLETAWAEISDSVSSAISADTLEVALWDAVTEEWNTLWTEALTSALDGLNGTDPLPWQNAGVVKFFTSVGRSIGKKFIFGLVEAGTQSQTWSATLLTDMALFAAAFDAVLTVTGATFTPGNFNALAGTFRQWIGTVEANLLVGTQDRRQRGVGL